MKRFVYLGGLMWVGGGLLALLLAGLIFSLYHATGLANLVTSMLAP